LLNITELSEKFSKVKVLIVGDVMLDRYWWGSVSRISPEAPVPVVKLDKTSVAAGGAANVAANVVGLGAETFLVGVVGDDSEAEVLKSILEDSKISSKYLISIKNHQTTVKTRIVAHSQHVVRLDQENTHPINESDESRIYKVIENLIAKADVVIISDYAKGLLSDILLSRLITICRENDKKILVDPKGKDYTKYRDANLLTPNRKEAVEACNLEESEKDLIEKAGTMLLDKISTEAILITQGEKGMTLFQKEGESHNYNALARKVYDVTGAGDTVIATLAVAIGAGLDYFEAANLANIAAGLVVEQIGTTSITNVMLANAISEAQI
jgi:rfaE bifunctional protein kinase chain/domain